MGGGVAGGGAARRGDASGDCSSRSIPEILGSAKNRIMFFGDHWGDEGESVKTPNAARRLCQRDSQEVRTSTALSLWRRQ